MAGRARQGVRSASSRARATGRSFDAESVPGRGLELLESFGDLLRLVCPGGGVFQIRFVMLDGGGGVFAQEGDFAQAPIDLVDRGRELLQRFVVPLGGVPLDA